MQPPTWKEANIPENMVRILKEMKPSYNMDCLVSQIVFHHVKKLTLTYHCDRCGYLHVPQRASEEICSCQQCGMKRVRCIQSVKMSNSYKKTPYYTRSGGFILQIIAQMKTNFIHYFDNAIPERDVDWEWHNGIYHVAFAGGETGCDMIPHIAVARAALLTPYLWDGMYDWKNECRRVEADQRFLTQHLSHLAPAKKDY